MSLFTLRGTAVVTKKAVARLAAGHPWIYKSDIASMPIDAPGFVEIVDQRGQSYGVALASPRSQITLRLIARQKSELGPDLIRGRLTRALARRESVMRGADAFRWVHGEADLLPSVFIDRYGDCIVLQTLSAGADLLEGALIDTIRDIAQPRAIVVRDDATARTREGLPTRVEVVHGDKAVVANYHEGALLLSVDLVADQKTGGFLDQAVNHQIAATYAHGEALDCFTYHGGFALQLATRCTSVLAVDVSEAALTRAAQNAARNGIGNVVFEEHDVFDLLPALLRDGKRFDCVVIDPPAFASNKASEEKAMRAYHEINVRAMRLTKPGGILVSCSCSGRVTPAMFDEMLQGAAKDAKRAVQILERRAAGPDHPVLLGVPETDYLKCRVLAVL